MRWLTIILPTLLALLWSCNITLANTSCQTCHTAPSLGSARVTPDTLRGSVHESLKCLDCHTGLQDTLQMHAVPAPPVNCQACHGSSPKMGAKSAGNVVHGSVGHGDSEKPSCADCHGDHQILRPSAVGSKTNRQNVQMLCSSCHGPDGQAAGRRKGAAVVDMRTSVHGAADPARPGLYPAVCTDCHGSHEVLPASVPGSRVSVANVSATCAGCHTDIGREYFESVHGRAIAQGKTGSATCASCHGEHNIVRTADPASPVSPAHVVGKCESCHADKTLIERYDLPVGVVGTFKESYHGKANQFGQYEAANCVSCHQPHLTLGRNDPRSSIHPDNLVATCGTEGCHPGIGDKVVLGQVHLELSPTSNAPVYWVEKVFKWFLWVVMGSLMAIVAGDFTQRIRRRALYRAEPKAPVDEVKVQRFTSSQLWQHKILIISFTMLVITGFPVQQSDHPASAWFINAIGGMEVRAMLHRFFGAMLLGVCFWHLFWTLSTRQGRHDFLKMLPEPADIGRAFGMVKYFLGIQKKMPAFGRFNLFDKFDYMAVAWGSVIMGVSGLALWFPEIALRYIPKWGLDICHVVHSHEAILAFLAIMFWHFYHVHYKPGTFPMSRIWIDGKVPLGEYKHEHSLEYERLKQEMESSQPKPDTRPEGSPNP